MDIAIYRAARACRPSLILFPRIVECDESVVEPLGKTRALEELLPQTLLVLDRGLAARRFQAMAALVAQTPVLAAPFRRGRRGVAAPHRAAARSKGRRAARCPVTA